jgi:hypothetical protein
MTYDDAKSRKVVSEIFSLRSEYDMSCLIARCERMFCEPTLPTLV